MKIILDTNIWVSFLIGKRLHVLGRLLTHPNFLVYTCDELLHEFVSVAQRPKIQKYISENDVQDTLAIMESFCIHVPTCVAPPHSVRDAKDAFLLALAHTIHADFLVTGDNDLLVLKKYDSTQIITFAELMCLVYPDELGEAESRMDKLWDEGKWNDEMNEQVLREHLRTPYHG